MKAQCKILPDNKKIKKYKELVKEIVIVKEEKVVCGYCGVYFDLKIARDRQYDWNKIRQEVVCPCCKSTYEKKKS